MLGDSETAVSLNLTIPAQTLLRSLLVVFTAPRFDQGLGVGQGRQPVLV